MKASAREGSTPKKANALTPPASSVPMAPGEGTTIARLKPTSTQNARVKSTWMPKAGVMKRMKNASQSQESGARKKAMARVRLVLNASTPERKATYTAAKREPGRGV